MKIVSGDRGDFFLINTAKTKNHPVPVIGIRDGYEDCCSCIFYTLKCAKALLASAIRCVSSFFLKAPPSPLLAAIISLANFSDMLRPFLSRLKRINHFILREIFLSDLTSAGIWKVAPPIRRLRTSTAGVTLDKALLHISYPFSLVCLLTRSIAS